jgi:HD-GYP domain-containing protein (c-di-GMP phosphodiesterase class II)
VGNRDDLRRALDDARTRMAGLEAELTDRARIDPVCGVLTRDAFRGDADAVLAHAAQSEQPLALVLVDIDGFRALNERLGRDAADAALAAVAERLRDLTRGTDVLGRTGARRGPRSSCPAPPSTARGSAAERLIAQLESAGQVTVSAGLASLRPGTTLDGLLAAAGRGVDRARTAGGSRAQLPCADTAAPEPDSQLHVIDRPGQPLVERDRSTGEHAEVVVGLARSVAEALGLCARTRSTASPTPRCCTTSARSASRTTHVLHKTGPLDAQEWVLMREHPVIGERILRAVPGMASVARMIRHEHERYDGGGYPDGLAGDDIPMGSRVILACDAYHAMTSDRPYRRAMDVQDAVTELCALRRLPVRPQRGQRADRPARPRRPPRQRDELSRSDSIPFQQKSIARSTSSARGTSRLTSHQFASACTPPESSAACICSVRSS